MAPHNTAGNPLSAESLTALMASSLPKDACPQLKNPFDAIALAIHAGMIAVGFRLIGLGEDHKIEASSEAQGTQPLPNEWNATSSYAFRYAHSQSALEYLIKVTRLGGKTVVFGLGLGDDKTAQFEIVARDYVSESSLPATPASESTSSEEAQQKLRDVFISPNRLNDLGSLLKTSIIQRLAPGIYKEGYEETAQTASSSDDRRRRSPPPREPERPHYDPLREDPQPPPARPYPFDDPLAAAPHRGGHLPEPIPGFDDELDIHRGPRGYAPQPGRSPLNIGENDLYPPGLGPHDPLRPSLGPGGGLPRPGGGMHPTFDDPLFGGRGGGARGYDPQAPPGSRYDPVGPGDPPRDNRMGPRFPGGRGGGGFSGGFGGAPPNPFGGFGGGDFI